MKKLIILSFALLITLAFFSCSNSNMPVEEQGQNQENDSEANLNQENVPQISEETEQNQSTELNSSNHVDYIGTKTETNDNQSVEVAPTTAELRNQKVTFELKYNRFFESKSEELTREYAGVIKTNSSGNEYIEYAINSYRYYVFITLAEEPTKAFLSRLLDYTTYDIGASRADLTPLAESSLLLVFYDFYSYRECQEELLNELSDNENVISVEVGFLNLNEWKDQDTPYDQADVLILPYSTYMNDMLISSYEDFCELNNRYLGLAEKYQGSITEQTFEENYVFFFVNETHSETIVSDMELIGDTLYVTKNRIYNGYIFDADCVDSSVIALVPKTEIGTFPEDFSFVVFYADFNV